MVTTDAPEAGKTYRLRHCRFGCATVKVLKNINYDEADGRWVDLEVVKGTLRGASRGASWGPGDTKTCRLSHCTFTET